MSDHTWLLRSSGGVGGVCGIDVGQRLGVVLSPDDARLREPGVYQLPRSDSRSDDVVRIVNAGSRVTSLNLQEMRSRAIYSSFQCLQASINPVTGSDAPKTAMMSHTSREINPRKLPVWSEDIE